MPFTQQERPPLGNLGTTNSWCLVFPQPFAGLGCKMFKFFTTRVSQAASLAEADVAVEDGSDWMMTCQSVTCVVASALLQLFSVAVGLPVRLGRSSLLREGLSGLRCSAGVATQRKKKQHKIRSMHLDCDTRL